MRQLRRFLAAPFLVTVVVSSPGVQADRIGQQLKANQVLVGDRSDYIGSTGDNYRLVMQTDCNLVLYAGSSATPLPYWASNTNGAGSGCRAIMQTDGNFVVYTDNNQPVWSSQTPGNPGDFLIMQDDGNVVVYQGQTAIWATNTNGQGFDIVTIVSENFTSTVWRIDRPNVIQPKTDYPKIRFIPGDTVSVSADGCVQTGGLGLTWKRYVDPRDANSDRLYHGLIAIPTATDGLKRLLGIAGKTPLQVKSVPEGGDPSRLFLSLGYEDDPGQYGDNGYWSHDDGTSDQCQNVGNAWLELTVTHSSGPPSTSPPPAIPTAPMDMWWSQVDDNLVPLNPFWAMQVNQDGSPNYQIPDPGVLCGNFHDEHDNLQLGSPPCTSQAPAVDEPSGSSDLLFWAVCQNSGGVSGGVHGHVNWGLATFTGQLFFKDHSVPFPSGTGDDDYDMTIQRFDEASATVNNDVFADFRRSLALEYDSDETVDYFDTPWWNAFHSAVDADGSGTTAQQMLGGADGAYAIVTGLLGIDTKHGPHAELHPVLGLATRVPSQSTSTTDFWVLFARPWGDEGGCSQDLHAYFPINTMQFLLPLPASRHPNIAGANLRTKLGGGSWSATQLSDGLLLTINFPPEITAVFGQVPKTAGQSLEPLVWGELTILHDPGAPGELLSSGINASAASNKGALNRTPQVAAPTGKNGREIAVKDWAGFPNLAEGRDEYLGVLKTRLTAAEWQSFVQAFLQPRAATESVQGPTTRAGPLSNGTERSTGANATILKEPVALPRSMEPVVSRHRQLQNTEKRVVVRGDAALNAGLLQLHQKIAAALESAVGTQRANEVIQFRDTPRTKPTNDVSVVPK